MRSTLIEADRQSIKGMAIVTIYGFSHITVSPFRGAYHTTPINKKLLRIMYT